MKQMASALCETVVNEEVANNSSYEPFLTSGQYYISEAKALLQDGYLVALKLLKLLSSQIVFSASMEKKKFFF